MLSNAQEKKIKQLHTKKGREKLGLCLVEGKKPIETAGDAIEFSFTRSESGDFDRLVTTETPQDVAAVATIPEWGLEDVKKYSTIVVLDGVQDPGNVGSILRLCLGFNASLILIDSVDVTNPKVIRSSVGAMFQVPWITLKREYAEEFIEKLEREVYKLEGKEGAKVLGKKLISEMDEEIVLIAGSEGQGVKMEINGTSLMILHKTQLESLNVTHALAISLYERFTNNN